MTDPLRAARAFVLLLAIGLALPWAAAQPAPRAGDYIVAIVNQELVTAGVTTRLLDPASGAELLRLGAVQRYLLREQRVTPEGTTLGKRFSDLLLLGSTRLVPAWTLDASLQYSPEIDRTVRSIVGARYSPGPFRTLAATYRYTRASSEQIELGWQWPIYRQAAPRAQLARPSASGSACAGTWYAVGRINYSMHDSRLTDSIVGFEYDAGCCSSSSWSACRGWAATRCRS